MRNPFKRAPVAPQSPPEPTLPARLADFELQLRAISAELTQLRLEWQETLDKITAWANRAAARDRRAVSKALEAPQSDDLAETHVPVTPHDPEAEKAALRRRAFGGRPLQ